MKGNLRLRFLYSYLVVLLVAVLLMGLTSAVSFQLFEGDILRKNALLLDHVRNNFDARLSEISKLSYEISYNDRLLNITRGGGSLSTLQAARLTRYLGILKTISQPVGDIAIYFPLTDTVVNNVGRFTADHYYRLTQKNDPASYRAFRETLSQNHTLHFAIEDIDPLSGKPEKVISFYHSFTLSGAGEDAPLMIIRLDNQGVEAMLDSGMMDGGEYLALLAEDGRPIAFTGNEALFERAAREWDAVPRTGTCTVASGTLYVAQAASNYKGLRYATISSKNTYLGALVTARDMLLWTALGVTAIELFIALYLSRRQARPIAAIARTLGEAPPEKDVYAYIEDNVRRLMRENDVIFRRLENQRGALKRMFLSQLLRGDVGDEAQFQRHCAQYDIDASEARHCAFIVYVRAVPSPVEQIAEGLLDYDDAVFALLRGAVRELSGALDPECDAEMTLVDGVYAGWLMLPDRADAASLREQYLRKLQRSLGEKYGVALGLACGSIYAEFNQLALSYAEALRAFDALMARGAQGMLFYEDIECEQPCADKAIDLIGRFVNCLKLQDYDNALRLTAEVFEEYLNVHQAPEAYALHKAAVLAMLLDAADLAGQRNGCEEALAPLRQALSAPPPICDLRQAAEELIRAMSLYKRREQQASAGRRLCELRAFIDEQYADPNLGLSLLADRYGMSNASLSKLFKAEFGIGVLDYINQARVFQAKRLLQNSDLNVAQIAQAVGYTSDITFIRVFKRYEGTTPGRYREAGGREN